MSAGDSYPWHCIYPIAALDADVNDCLVFNDLVAIHRVSAE